VQRSWTHPVAGILLGVALALPACRRAAPLPTLGQLPHFSLITSDERPLTQADLKGQVWVADFIFTNCPGICPLLSTEMARLQSALSEADLDDVRLVSFSVDPARDSPAALNSYAERYGADRRNWWFVTGERSALYELIAQGFQLAVAERTPGDSSDANELITHSDRFVLVDRDLRIRGYYRPVEEGVRDRLLADIRTLVR